MRFSTCPSSATSTTSARSGSSRTNSMCLSRVFDFTASTTPAARVSPESNAGRFGQHRVDRLRGAGRRDLRLDRLPVALGHIADLHQRVDEEAQAPLGRQPPGRGVRRIDEAELLEVRHDVAHGGRRQGHRDDAREVARADRLAGRQIAFDDLAEDLARALVELREARLRWSERNVLRHRSLRHLHQNCP